MPQFRCHHWPRYSWQNVSGTCLQSIRDTRDENELAKRAVYKISLGSSVEQRSLVLAADREREKRASLPETTCDLIEACSRLALVTNESACTQSAAHLAGVKDTLGATRSSRVAPPDLQDTAGKETGGQGWCAGPRSSRTI